MITQKMDPKYATRISAEVHEELMPQSRNRNRQTIKPPLNKRRKTRKAQSSCSSQ
jgi:hypothetical protein